MGLRVKQVIGAVGLDANNQVPVINLHLVLEEPRGAGYYEELPANSINPTSAIWWTSSAKTLKIIEYVVTYNADGTCNTLQEKVYAADGVTMIQSFTDTYSYVGGFLTPTRTRA